MNCHQGFQHLVLDIGTHERIGSVMCRNVLFVTAMELKWRNNWLVLGTFDLISLAYNILLKLSLYYSIALYMILANILFIIAL